jgi:hypothetical protein
MNQINDSQSRPSEDSMDQILPSGQAGATQDLKVHGITKVTEYHVSYHNPQLGSN